MKKRLSKSVASVIMAASMAVTAAFGGVSSEFTNDLGWVLNVKAAENQNPALTGPKEREVDEDGKMEMVWNCIYFGEYPQSKVTHPTRIKLLQNLDESNWVALENPATGEKGTMAYYVAASGTKYLRMKMNDATYATSGSSNYYDWQEDSENYHYFTYEPIKWRILSSNEDGSDALLVADKTLDAQVFHPTKDITYVNGQPKDSNRWKYSTIRSFLNGYDESVNTYDYDYSNGYNFKSMAFSEKEQAAILNTEISNKESYHHYFDGTSTKDDIFLLSYKEAAGVDGYAAYGFTKDRYRYTQNTEFCRAMGAFTNYGYNYSWLRSSGDGTYRVNVVCYSGDVHKGGNDVDTVDYGVRPALHLDLTDTSLWSYAGEVDCDGRLSYYKATFNLDGVKTVNYTDVQNTVSIPYGFEEEGYEYTYVVGNTDVTEELKQGTYVVGSPVTINVTKTKVYQGTFVLDGVETKVNSDKNGELNVPENYEVSGYDYTYYCNGEEITSWPIKVAEDVVIEVEKESHNVITVYYKNTSWSEAYIHFKAGDESWTSAPGVKMQASTEKAGYNWKYEIELGDATKATVCFNNGNGAWDSKNGANYYLSTPGMYGIKNSVINEIVEATATPTVAPTEVPTVTVAPTEVPTVTVAPTEEPTVTVAPTVEPTATVAPTATPVPTEVPVSNTVTVYYNNTSWSQAYIHYQNEDGKWTAVPGVKMEASTEKAGYNWKYVIDLGEGTNTQVCFNNGNGSWDSKNGNNYYLGTPGTYGISNTAINQLAQVTPGVTEAPTATPAPTEVPVSNTVTIYYKNASWSQAYIHYKAGNNSWTVAPGVKMDTTTENGYTWKYVIELGEDTAASVCFNNGSGSWDSKNGANYNITQPGAYGIQNQSVSKLVK